MHVCVIGAGVAGLASAFALVREGHQVTVVDRNGGPGLETSYANAGQLSYSYVAPFAGPGVLGKLPAWLLDPSSATRFRPRLDPGQWKWIWKFVRACNARQAEYATAELLGLAALSRQILHELIEEDGLDFSFESAGKLVVHSTPAGFEKARRQMLLQARYGAVQQALSREECLALEPALEGMSGRIAGGVYSPGDEVGDCLLFCGELDRILRDNGARFVYSARVDGLSGRLGKIVAARTSKGDIEADAFVISTGNASRALLRPHGIDLPIYPLRGFSLTVPVTDGSAIPSLSLTDYDRRIAYARIGDRFRAAALVDLVGYDKRLNRSRIGLVTRQMLETFPDGLDYDSVDAWCGLRPATPTGLPIISRTGHFNLYLNTGHGGLGFTLALGSGEVLAALISGRESGVDPAPYALS